MLGTSSTPLVYPWGTSPVHYVGQSGNLHKRLGLYRSSILEGRQFGQYCSGNWWPRYQYDIALGVDCCWYSSPHCGRTPKELETQIIKEFHWHIGSIAVANGSWPSREDRPAGEWREGKQQVICGRCSNGRTAKSPPPNWPSP